MNSANVYLLRLQKVAVVMYLQGVVSHREALFCCQHCRQNFISQGGKKAEALVSLSNPLGCTSERTAGWKR